MYESLPVEVNTGRFGPYVKRNGLFVSIKKDAPFDLWSIDYDQAVQLLEEKKKADAQKHIHEFRHGKEMIQVLNGPYGPYIKYGKKNYKIPKG